MMRCMRTTIDLPEHLHRMVRAIARDEGKSMSRTIADLLQRLLTPEPTLPIDTDERTGFRVVRLGRPVTSEDVRSLEDEE
jgi:metal-responsive CopG/Arc/MetJ family transcriptional regulator